MRVSLQTPRHLSKSQRFHMPARYQHAPMRTNENNQREMTKTDLAWQLTPFLAYHPISSLTVPIRTMADCRCNAFFKTAHRSTRQATGALVQHIRKHKSHIQVAKPSSWQGADQLAQRLRGKLANSSKWCLLPVLGYLGKLRYSQHVRTPLLNPNIVVSQYCTGKVQ